MNDMSQVIIPRSDQINSDDLLGRTMTITVASVQLKGGQEQPVSIYFEGSDKAFRPCKSMCRVLVQGWGLDANQYVGRSLTLYCDPTVKFGPLAVGGIRISHMSHIDGPMTMALTATKGVKKAYKVLPLVVERASTDGLTLDQARSDIEFAASLDDLKTVWTRKAMAPHRAALQADLDARKAALSGDTITPDSPNAEEGPADEDRGEAHTDDPRAELIARLVNYIGTATDKVAIDTAETEFLKHRPAMEPEHVGQIEAMIAAARKRVRGE